MMFLQLLLLGLLGFAPAAPAEVQVPRNDGWVTDLADVLSASQEAELTSLMESYKQGSTHEIALLTVPDLGGESIERFALEVGRAWGIGGEKNNGALIVVSTGDRKMRIEVGRGLEGNLTDLVSGRIIRDVMTPHFRSNDYPGGLRAGVLATHAAIGGDYGPIQRSSGGRRSSRGSGSSVMFLVMLGLFFLVGGGRGGRGRGGSIWPWLILGSMAGSGRRSGGFHGGGGFGGGGGGFSGFGGGGGFSGGGASGGW